MSSNGTAVDEDVVDAEVVEPDAQAPAATTTAGTALAPRARRSEVIRPLNAEQLVQSFGEYQELLPKLLVESDYQAAEAGKKFVKKSGWRKIATAFDLDVQILAEDVERDENGRILRAKTTARATAPSGRVMDGDGYCTADEFTGRRANNPKMENDLRGTAATRAKNRAISDLVGMGEVSAEEVDAGGGGSSSPVEVEASPELKQAVRSVLTFLLDGDEHAVSKALDALDGQFEKRLPRAAGQAVCLVAKAVKDKRNPPAEVPIDTDGLGS